MKNLCRISAGVFYLFLFLQEAENIIIMSYTQKGKITQILKAESGVSKVGNAWTKQEFVIETQDQFPKKICFTLFGDKVSLLNGLSENTEVEVSFNVESREFNGKWYHNINAWKIEPVNAAAPSGDFPPEFTATDIPPERDDDPNDLPF